MTVEAFTREAYPGPAPRPRAPRATSSGAEPSLGWRQRAHPVVDAIVRGAAAQPRSDRQAIAMAVVADRVGGRSGGASTRGPRAWRGLRRRRLSVLGCT